MSNPPSSTSEKKHAPSESNPLAGGCPVAHHGAASTANPHAGMKRDRMAGCPVAHGGNTPAAGQREPPTSNTQHAAAASSSTASSSPSSSYHLPPPASHNLPLEGEFVPSNSIPAAGRGNSDDGREWLNPSANQLFRALARKEKPIEPEDASSVAAVHVAVTDNTWQCIMEYEKLHAK